MYGEGPRGHVITQTWSLPPGILLRGADVLAKFAEKVNYIREFYFLFTSTGDQKVFDQRNVDIIKVY